MSAFFALVQAGFGRYASYRRATVAAAATNTTFGFLKVSVMFAVLGARPNVAGYDERALVTFVWVGQGLLGVVQLFSWTEVADRIRTGDIVADLLRPLAPLWAFLAADLGRAGHALLVRLTVPVAVGALVFGLRWPARWATWPAFACSVLLATVICFGVRYLMNLTAFWWLDVRGANLAWLLGGSMLSGLTVPLAFFPGWAERILWWTPFPWLFQAPMDLLLERGSTLTLLGGQALMLVAVLGSAVLLERVAVRKLVVQGG